MDQDETMNEGDIRILDEKRNAPMSEISCEEVFIDDLVSAGIQIAFEGNATSI